MLRNAGAVIAGLVIGMVFNMVVIRRYAAIFPLPEGVDMTTRAQMREAIRDMPAASWILVFVAHLGQAFFGGWVAARQATS